MSDAPDAQAVAIGVGELASRQPSAGTLLRQAREAAGMHIGALSVSLKVPVKKLEALEADRLDLLPDAVFARALAASVCRTLKADPGPILARLPEQVMPLLTLDSSTSNHASLRTRRALWNVPALAGLPTPVLVVAGVFVLAALVLFFLPTIGPEPSTSGADHPAPVVVEIAGAGATASASSPGPAVPVPSGLPAVAAPTPSPVAAAVAPLPPAPVVAPKAATVPSSDAGPVQFKAKTASWVQVTDAAGTVQLRRTLNPGEAIAVAGTLPLAVVVGRADAVEVLVRGQPFDLAPLAKDNIARFQIK